MRPGRILIGQVSVVLGLIVLTLWFATQWAAFKLGHQAALGAPWFHAGEYSIYKPWRLFQWWYAYEAYAPDIFARAGMIAASGGLIGIIAAVIGSVIRSRDASEVTTYGSARWASPREIKKLGLLGNKGVFLGQSKSSYLRHDGAEHVMAFAPTRSGKGVGLVVPTLLSWTSSVVVHDIKGENWSLTSGWRSQFSTCIRFDPTDKYSPRFNPLSEVRLGEREVADAQNIADILVDPDGTLERGSHWEKTAHALLVGVILHVLYAEEDKTLAGCANFLADPDRDFTDALDAMLTTEHFSDRGGVHPVVASAARELLNKSDNERSGVLSTAMSFLSLYRDPVIAEITSDSDWALRDITNGDRPMSLYLACPPSDLSRTRPLMRLIINQIGRHLTEKMPSEDRRKLLLMLDEFPALGRLEFFEKNLAYFAGFGVRAYLITQSLNQIEKAYGPNSSILDNCHIRIAFSTNDERTAKRISEALGTKTELRAQKNYTGHRLAPWLSHIMESRQETQRPLLTPGEIMQLSADEEIIMVSGAPPVRARKLRYYTDKNFTERLFKEAPVTAQILAQKKTTPMSEVAASKACNQTGQKSSSLTREIDLTPERLRKRPRTPEVSPKTQRKRDRLLLDRVKAIKALGRSDRDMPPDF